MIESLTVDDKREITSLVIDNYQIVRAHYFVVGSGGVTKIEAYNEFAGPDYVLWFAVYVGPGDHPAN